MARAARVIVQSERLSNQVYQLLADELHHGGFEPGQRLVEKELALRFNVSRTPVREALVQLAREGLVVGNDRGYAAPFFTRTLVLQRLQVRRLLAPKVAELAALNADEKHLKAYERHLERARACHKANNVKGFNAAEMQIRGVYRSMCPNPLLVRCISLTDSQGDLARMKIHENPDNRAKTLADNERIFQALQRRDGAAAAAAVNETLKYIEDYYVENLPPDPS
jgi:DNA-binding GntR family transcriptional regulator